MVKFDFILLSCEHAGNKVPHDYKTLFEPHLEMLESHRGYDPGALEAAERLAERLQLPLYYHETTRLLVEPNRSIGSPDLFSGITGKLSDEEKNQILEEYYFPYRNKLDEIVDYATDKGKRVLHISVHSCTPVLDGEVRNMDYGILFDPERAGEAVIAKHLKESIHKRGTELLVRYNYPYLGISDGVISYFRKKYDEDEYLGIEIEINQKYPLGEDKEQWNHIQDVLAEAIEKVCDFHIQE